MEAKAEKTQQSSYAEVMKRFNSLANMYSSLPMDSIYSAFGRAMANFAPVQNSRIKSLSPLPADVSKNDLNEFLRNPANNELNLQRVAQGLKWNTYPVFKLQKSYADYLTYKHYVMPEYITAEELKSDTFNREYKLVDKFIKSINIPQIGHQVAGQAILEGKVFYVSRFNVDKSHNKVNYTFLQKLPSNYTQLIGYNNVSKYVLSFNLNYFLQIGTDYKQFGDLFEPFMRDWFEFIQTPDNQKRAKRHEKFVYATKNNTQEKAERDVYQANGRWAYYVSLPIERCWVFEIDDTTPIVASPLSGLMQTFAQQADYEAAQLSLILNPLIKIFTGEIPYTKAENSTQEDAFRLSIGGRALFEAYWDSLMSSHNTGGTAFFSAPVENIKSHDFQESANANSVSKSFLDYAMTKSGTQGIIPITDRPTEEMVKASEKLEPRFAQNIYRTLENMLNYILNHELSLKYEWRVHIFGDIYSDEITRANALKELDKGDLSQYFVLAALNDQSVLDKLAMCDVVSGVGLLDRLQVPQTAYTQSGKFQPKSDTGGAPSKDQTQVEETKIEKQVEVTDNV